MAMFCTNCGEKLDGNALFCTGCGQKTENAAPTPLFTPAPEPEPEPKTEAAPTPRPTLATPSRRVGGEPMAAVSQPPPKSGSSKLLIWMGVLALLVAITGGLAYVAFQQFVHGGSEEIAAETVVEDTIADAGSAFGGDEAPEPSAVEDSVEAPIVDVPAEPEPEPEAVVEAPAPVAPAPTRTAPVSAPKPAPRPTPAPAPKPTPVRSDPPVAAPAPVASTPVAPVPAPKPVQTAPSVQGVTPPPAPKPAADPAPPPPAPKGSKVMLSGTDAYSPPPAPPEAAPKAGGIPGPRPAPTVGDVFWSGTLKKNQIVTVDFRQGSAGVGGQALPGKPVRLETFSPVVEITELPGPGNGWKRFAFKATRDAKKSVTLNFHWTLTQ